MQVKDNKVIFGYEDIPFLNTFGFQKAVEKVNSHYKSNKVPFIYDTFQLAKVLNVPRKDLFELVRTADKRYKKTYIPKKNGGQRILQMPVGVIKDVQKRILDEILYKIPVSKYAMAYIPRKKLSDNALPHIGHKYLLKMDITDFFNSITFLKVISTAFNSNRFPQQIAVMLTKLCCMNEALPQGAPTSPMLSNITMKNFDDNIGKWCEKRGIVYTRYCDDLTFSSDKPLYHVFSKVKAMLEYDGFEINERKTHFIRSTARQEVTGIVVNEKMSIPREYKRNLRQQVYYAIKYGIENTSSDYDSLLGKISYVLQIEPDNEWFKQAFEKLSQK